MIVLLLTVLVVGPAFTRLTENSYFLHPATLLYFPRNLSLKWLQYDLPGVFRNNPYAISDGRVMIPSEPGWGIEIDPAWLESATYQISNAG